VHACFVLCVCWPGRHRPIEPGKRAHTYRQKLKEEGDRGGDGGGEERRRETHANAHTHRYLERQTQRHKTVT
jgi:hypothetical protein